MSKLPSEALVTTSVAPKHYGVSAGSIFDPMRDSGQSKYLDEYEGVWRCETMTWYINKGDDLQRSRKIDFPFYRKFEPNPSHSTLQIEEELLECSLEKAPIHAKAGKSGHLLSFLHLMSLTVWLCLPSLSMFSEGLAPSVHRKATDILSYLGLVTRNCILKCDLSVVPKSAFRKKAMKNEEGTEVNYWELHYRLLVMIEGALLRFGLVCGGVEYGQVEAEY